MFRRPFLVLAPLALLAACATPQQQCLSQNSVELRAVQSQISSIEATLARGYALHVQRVPYTAMGVCFSKAKGGAYPCPETRWRDDERPVAVDMNDQRARLSALKKKLPALQKAYTNAEAACRAAYPE